MEGKNRGADFLHKKYQLDKSPQVEGAVALREKREGERVKRIPEVRIDLYLSRIRGLAERKDSRERERGLNALRRILHNEVLIDTDIAFDGN